MSIFKDFNYGIIDIAIMEACKNSECPDDITHEFLDNGLDYYAGDGRAFLHEELDKWIARRDEEPEEPIVHPENTPVNLTFVQTVQWNEECGFWFTSVKLQVVHSYGVSIFENGEVFMKKTHNKSGVFKANLSSIPFDAEVEEAFLIMKLEKHEGIANSDRTGVFEIRNDKGVAIAEVTADWINSNYQKYSNPNVKIDVTSYIRGLRG